MADSQVKPTKEKKERLEEAENRKFAVIRTGGKQYLVHENDTIKTELLPEGAINFETLLYVDGREVKIGTPVLDKVSVKAKVGEIALGKKEIVFKYKAKKNYRVKSGHRQKYSSVTIEKIEAS